MTEAGMVAAEVTTGRHGAIEVVALNRPARANALNEGLVAGLLDRLSRAAADDDVHAVVVTGAGQAFCAGGDLEMLRGWRDLDIATRAQVFRRSQRLATELLGFPKPVVGAINGAAAGAGFDLAMCCDLVVAAESATFRTAFAGVGLVPDLGGAWLLPRLVGLARARRLLITGEVLDAAAAQDWGLIAEVVAVDRVVDAAVVAARSIVAAATLPALREIKRALLVGASEPLEAALERSAVAQAALMDTPEHLDRTRAFLAHSDR